MARWVRFARDGAAGFGTLAGETIAVHDGELFASPRATGRTVGTEEVELLTPATPTKMVALWNNFRALGEKLGLAVPEDPLYFLKAPSSFAPSGTAIRRPRFYDGRIIFEGELGIVIGRRCRDADDAEAERCIFGYTCVNDVTAIDVLNKDASFAQWTRAKSHDTFGIFGPAVVSGLDPATLRVRTLVDGEERQNYPVSDMIFPPVRLVSLISRDMTLEPGDVIACGTSIGAGRLKPGNTVEIVIDGIGTLRNRFEDRAESGAATAAVAASGAGH